MGSGRRAESNFILFLLWSWLLMNQNHPTPPNDQQLQSCLLGALAFIYPVKSSQNYKCHTTAETICTWQNHISATAWGKLYSTAADTLKQSQIPTPEIKIKTPSYKFFFKKPNFQNSHHTLLYQSLIKEMPHWFCLQANQSYRSIFMIRSFLLFCLKTKTKPKTKTKNFRTGLERSHTQRSAISDI